MIRRFALRYRFRVMVLFRSLFPPTFSRRCPSPRSGDRSSAALRCLGGALLGLSLAIAAPLHADEIILKNGRIIQGSARIAGSRVIIQPYDSEASVVLPLDRIETIIPKEAPSDGASDAAAPSQKPAAAPASAPAAVGRAHDAANVPLSEPVFSQDPALPRISYHFDPAPDPQVRSAVESVFPRIVAICMSELGMSLEEEIPLNIRIFHDLAAFEEQKTNHSDIHYAVEGYYAVEDDTIVVWGNEVRQQMVATIYHEATHALLRREFSIVPSWIDEGLAEYFEGFRSQGSAAVALTPQYNNGWAKRFLLEDQLLPLDQYLRLTNHQWVEADRDPQNLARITAWSLVAFLMESDGGRHALRRYLQSIARGAPSEAVATGYQELDAAYPGGIASLERNWRKWILEERKAQSY